MTPPPECQPGGAERKRGILAAALGRARRPRPTRRQVESARGEWLSAVRAVGAAEGVQAAQLQHRLIEAAAMEERFRLLSRARRSGSFAEPLLTALRRAFVVALVATCFGALAAFVPAPWAQDLDLEVRARSIRVALDVADVEDLPSTEPLLLELGVSASGISLEADGDEARAVLEPGSGPRAEYPIMGGFSAEPTEGRFSVQTVEGPAGSVLRVAAEGDVVTFELAGGNGAGSEGAKRPLPVTIVVEATGPWVTGDGRTMPAGRLTLMADLADGAVRLDARLGAGSHRTIDLALSGRPATKIGFDEPFRFGARSTVLHATARFADLEGAEHEVRQGEDLDIEADKGRVVRLAIVPDGAVRLALERRSEPPGRATDEAHVLLHWRGATTAALAGARTDARRRNLMPSMLLAMARHQDRALALSVAVSALALAFTLVRKGED